MQGLARVPEVSSDSVLRPVGSVEGLKQEVVGCHLCCEGSLWLVHAECIGKRVAEWAWGRFSHGPGRNGGGSAEAWGEVKSCVEEVERAGLWKQPV